MGKEASIREKQLKERLAKLKESVETGTDEDVVNSAAELKKIVNALADNPNVALGIPKNLLVEVSKSIAKYSGELEKIFSYTGTDTVPGKQQSNKYKLEATRKDLLEVGFSLITARMKNGVPLGSDPKFLGLVDDTAGYTPESILAIERIPIQGNANGNSANDSKNGLLTYTNSSPGALHVIKFNYRLKRFPKKVKTLHYGEEVFLKQFTSTTSDIITFEYEGMKIEFGAMLPFGAKRAKLPARPGFDGYSDTANYSLACCLAGRFSIYTDYKLEQGKTYTVTLGIDPGDGYNGQVYIEIDGVKQNTATWNGRVWGRKFNAIRKSNYNMNVLDPKTGQLFDNQARMLWVREYSNKSLIASQPGFLTAGFKALYTEDRYVIEMMGTNLAVEGTPTYNDFKRVEGKVIDQYGYKPIISETYEYLQVDYANIQSFYLQNGIRLDYLKSIKSVPYDVPVINRFTYEQSLLLDPNLRNFPDVVYSNRYLADTGVQKDSISTKGYLTYHPGYRMRKINNGVDIGNIEIFAGVKPA